VLPQFLQGRIRPLADRLLQPVASGLVEGRGMAPAMRRGAEVPGLPVASPQAGDEGQADAEAAGDLAPGAFVVLDGSGDPLAEVQGIGLHNASSPRKGAALPLLHATLSATQT
jgi:hypothetical protein